MAKTKYGYMPCRDCGERVVVKVNEKETLTYTCDECGDQGVARKSEANYATWQKRITRAPGADKPAEKPGEKPAAKAAEKKGGVLDDII